MITYYQRTSETAGLTEQDKISSGSWVRSERPTTSDIETLHKFGIDADLLTDALDPHEVPRIEHDDGWTYFITRVPDVGDNFNDYTTPMMFALGKDQTVTVSRDSLGRLWLPFVEKTTISPGQQSKLFLSMVEIIFQSYQQRVTMINRQMRALTSNIQSLRPHDISMIAEHERKLNDYLDALIPTNTALEKTLNPRFNLLRLSDDDQDMVEDLSVDIEQVIARCKSLLRTITNVRDSYRAVMDTRLNETMRVLTVVTLSLTIPTMISGVFGMNVALPVDLHDGAIFWIVIVVSLIAAASVSAYFLRKR